MIDSHLSVLGSDYSLVLYQERTLKESDINNKDYFNRLLKIYIYAIQNIKAYLWKRTKDNIVFFKNSFQIDKNQVIVLQNKQELPPLQAEVIRAVHAVYQYDQGNQEKLKTASCLLSQRDIIINDIGKHLSALRKEQRNPNGSSLKELPEPLISHILMFLDSQSSLSLSETCHYFHAANHLIKQAFQLESPQFHVSDAHIKAYSSEACLLVEKLCFHGGSFTPEALAELIVKCPRLKSIEFQHCLFPNFQDYIAAVVANAKSLEAFKATDCFMNDQALFELAAVRELRSFEYTHRQGKGALTDKGLMALFSMSQCLEVIKITGCPHVTSTPLCHLVERKIDSTVKELPDNLNQGCQKTGEKKLEPIGMGFNGSQIKELSFSYCGATLALWFDSLKDACPNLESFEMSLNETQGLESLKQKNESLRVFLEGMVKLNTLKLKDCTYLDLETLESGYILIEPLKHLELYRCVNLHSDFFEALHCPSLKTFKFEALNKGTKLNKKDFETLYDRCPKLETLTLIDCHIPEAGIQAYLAKKPALKHLELIRPAALQADMLLDLLAECCPHLESLTIELAESIKPKVQDIQVKNFLIKCKFLRKLHLKLYAVNPRMLPSTQMAFNAFQSPFNFNPSSSSFSFHSPSSSFSNQSMDFNFNASTTTFNTTPSNSNLFQPNPLVFDFSSLSNNFNFGSLNAGSISYTSEGLSIEVLDAVADYAPRLTELTFDGLRLDETATTKSILKHFKAKCTKIKCLGLPNSQMSSEMMASLIEHYAPNLQSFNIEGAELTTDAQFAFQKLLACQKMQFLNLKKTTINIKNFSELLSSMPCLSYVDAKGCKQLEKDEMAILAIKKIASERFITLFLR